MQNTKSGYANTLPSKRLLIEGITRDLPIEACIFDLIDNSIDSSASQALTISVAFNGHHFSITDNGAGISFSKMENEALMAGSQGHDKKGIGVFGIGLNRALYKLGRVIDISSETSNERVAVSNWNILNYLKSSDWNVPIVLQEKVKKIGTTIEVGELNDDVSAKLSDFQWAEALKKEISKRYALFIQRGINILVNGKSIKSFWPAFREDSKFTHPTKSFTIGDVSIKIECGEHIKHKFSNESGYKEKSNKQLTSEYGWYVYCNNRGILLSDRSPKTGWSTVEHSQHHGFIGLVHFDGPSIDLPWSTDKVDVDHTSAIYVEALKEMERSFTAWRAFTGRMRSWQPTHQLSAENEQTKAENADTNCTVVDSASEEKQKNIDTTESIKPDCDADKSFAVEDHPQNWVYLFGAKKNSRVYFCIPKDEKKLLAVVKELQGLKLKDNPCAIMLLLRVLIEESCKLYRKRNNNNPNIPRALSLAQTVEKCLDSMITKNMITDEHEIHAIRTLCAERGKRVLSIEYLQNSVHSSRSFLSEGVIRPFWNEIEAFIIACFK